MNILKQNMRRGNIALFVVIVTAVSLVLTAASTINEKNRQSTSVDAQLPTTCQDVGLTCVDAAAPICEGGPAPYPCGSSSEKCCKTSTGGGGGGGVPGPDAQYIGNTCVLSDNRQGVCEYTKNCVGDAESVPGYCSGSSNAVQCCVPLPIGQTCVPPDGRQGVCEYTTNCAGDVEAVAGICTGAKKGVTCCAPKAAAPPGGGGGGGAGQPARGKYLIGGKVQKSDSGGGLQGVSVTIGTVDANGANLPINGQPTFTTTTDPAGDWVAEVALAPGDAYFVRPQGTGPAGYASAPRSSNDTHSKQANTGQNTPISQTSYEQQVVGQQDCAATPGWPNGACNFVYDPVAGAPPPPGAGAPPPAGGGGAECLIPLYRYFNPAVGRHFYTTNFAELGAGNATWQKEADMGYVEKEGMQGCWSASTQPFYRFVQTGTDIHFYQINTPAPPDATWTPQGIVGYINAAPDPAKDTTILERFYHAGNLDHFYTNWGPEADALKANGGGYVYEFPAGWTFGDVAKAASQQGAGGGGTQPPPPPPKIEMALGPSTSTGNGVAGYEGFVRNALDCTNGYSASATYTAEPTNPGELPKPTVYYNIEQVTGPEQAGLGKGKLLGEDTAPNGGTFSNQNVVAEAANGPIMFYVYTVKETTDPQTQYTIHGVNGTAEVSAAPFEPAPQPYTLSCPGATAPLPGDPALPPVQPPVVALPPQDIGVTVKKDMDITIKIFTPSGPGGTPGGGVPTVASIPVDIAIHNSVKPDDNEIVTINMDSKGSDLWEGKYSTAHYPGMHFAVTIWPKKHMKKTICHVGNTSAHVVYPKTYQCNENEGTIVLKSGANFLDFSQVIIGGGDVNTNATRDGHVDSQDLFQLAEYLRNPDRNDLDAADINFDGVVNQTDYDLAVWSLENVPE